MAEEHRDMEYPPPRGGSLNIGGVWKVRLMPSPHVHGHVEINLILDGAMTYLFNGRTATLQKGDLGLFWAAIPHRVIELEEPTYFICIDLPVEMFLATSGSEALKTAILQGGMLVADRVSSFEAALFRGWHDDMAGGDESVAALVRDELAARLRRIAVEGWRDLATEEEARRTPARPGHPKRDRVHRMARHIAEHAAGPISVAEVAAAAGLHPNYAMTLFREALGMTINEYLTRQRLVVAQARLLSGEGAVATIAAEAGFGSLSRFYEAFRERYRCTPGDMRRNFRQTREAASG